MLQQDKAEEPFIWAQYLDLTSKLLPKNSKYVGGGLFLTSHLHVKGGGYRNKRALQEFTFSAWSSNMIKSRQGF